MYRFPWYLTLVSTNHASSNPGQIVMFSVVTRLHEMSETIKIPQRKQFFCKDLRIKNYDQQMHISNCENNCLN